MFEDLGVNADYLLLGILILLLGLLFFNLVMVMKFRQLKSKYHEFMRGANGKTLEERILMRFKQIDKLNDRIDDTIDRVKLLEDARDTSFKKIATQKFFTKDKIFFREGQINQDDLEQQFAKLTS